MNEQNERLLWQNLIENAQLDGDVLSRAMADIGKVLHDILGHDFVVEQPRIEIRPIQNLATHIEHPESEVVGIYLLISEDLLGKVVLILGLEDAITLAGWLVGEDLAGKHDLNELERSALAEVGNQILSKFLNVVAQAYQVILHPSPPALMVDMLATVLETLVATVAPQTDELLVIKNHFVHEESNLRLRLWIFPDPSVSPIDQLRSGKHIDSLL